MTDTDQPPRGPSGNNGMTSRPDAPKKGDVSPSKGSSSVEKAAEKLTRVRDADAPSSNAGKRPNSDQTSSIERFLNANPEDNPPIGPAEPISFDEGTQASPLNEPISQAADPVPVNATSVIDPASGVNPAPVNPAPVEQAPVEQAPVEQAGAPQDEADVPVSAQSDAVIAPEPVSADPAAAPGSENPYRAAHPDLDDPREAYPDLSGDADRVAMRQKRGLFRRKQKDPKPWHRNPAEQEAAISSDQRADEQTGTGRRKRGLFGLMWAGIRFLLIGKKRTIKARAPKGRAPRRSSPGSQSRLVPRLLSGLSAVLILPRTAFAQRLKTVLLARISGVPGLRRLTRTKAEVVAEIERIASETPAGIAEIAAENRRSAAGSHIRRPLDMSRRIGRTVEIDIEKIRAAGMVTPSGERSHIAEEFRLIKRPLLLNAFEKGANAIRNGNVIMVASSRSGEGKTFMAINLAMSIASERDLTVLLIDADVAKPDIPNVLGFEADLGLVDLIADDQIDVSDVIMRTNIENLSVMPAGRPHHLATELLASERMGNLVSELSLRYPERVVIMDSPPALLSSVAGVLALNVGQTLFVVEAERTSQTAVDSAIGLVSACKHINLLLNKSRPLGGGERFGSYKSGYY